MTDAPPTIQELPFGFTWVQDEPMARASHALVADGRVWIVDPVDSPGVVERAQGLGEVAAVVQLLDRHNRDCEAIASRLGVPHLTVPDDVPDSPFEVVRVVHWPKWAENALWWPAQRALVVAEAVGTAPLFTLGKGAVGVHAMLRPMPPRKAAGRLRPRSPARRARPDRRRRRLPGRAAPRAGWRAAGSAQVVRGAPEGAPRRSS